LRDERIGGNVFELLGACSDAVEIGANTDVIDAGDFHDVVDVIAHIVDRPSVDGIGCLPAPELALHDLLV
jgi:hypothetical protein